MRKYRIIEEKYEHVSYFYPQYKIETDENGKNIKSEYQNFSGRKKKRAAKREGFI